MNKEELIEKHNLVSSSTYKKIRAYLLDEITEKAGSNIEPLKLQGLLLAVKIIDGWDKKYFDAVNKEINKKEE